MAGRLCRSPSLACLVQLLQCCLAEICPQVSKLLQNSAFKAASEEHPHIMEALHHVQRTWPELDKECGGLKGYGWYECRGIYFGGIIDRFDDAHTDEEFRAAELQPLFAHLQEQKHVRGLPRRFSSSELATISPAYYIVEESRGVHDELKRLQHSGCHNSISIHAGDAVAWAAAAKILGCHKHNHEICECPEVVCWAFNTSSELSPADSPCPQKELRIVGLTLVYGSYLQSGELDLLSEFQNLLFLDMQVDSTSKHFPDVPNLRTLRLRFQGATTHILANLPQGVQRFL
eukprot:TRINITY_DN81082_c0_g1_i1.p1 TRINITY_DN81082_c0_g1~~TRINITY_DN81082_c0_g1_i1.p1  ORF type:complete len:289 (+),score=56.45 TRINITY_DN81082_c0_g1_i1:62-928(+)